MWSSNIHRFNRPLFCWKVENLRNELSFVTLPNAATLLYNNRTIISRCQNFTARLLISFLPIHCFNCPLLFFNSFLWAIDGRDCCICMTHPITSPFSEEKCAYTDIYLYYFCDKQTLKKCIEKKRTLPLLQGYSVSICYHMWFHPTVNTFPEKVEFFCILFCRIFFFFHSGKVSWIFNKSIVMYWIFFAFPTYFNKVLQYWSIQTKIGEMYLSERDTKNWR